MKKLGLIGGTGPESTVIYYREITARVQRATGNFPRMAVESLSVYDVLRIHIGALCGMITGEGEKN